MRLVELFLRETTEEDRAIISLSSAIYDYLKKYNGTEESEIHVGKIGELFNTPLNILDEVGIVLMNNERMREYLGTEEGKTSLGLWEPGDRDIVLNSDYLQSNYLKTTISHELRHALDDFKSGFKASSSKRYATPKNKQFRNLQNDPYASRLEYIAQPAEINARFLQVMHAVTAAVSRAKNMDATKAKSYVEDAFKRNMENFHIAELFPEKTASKDYKRLLKRGVDFLNKELQNMHPAYKK